MKSTYLHVGYPKCASTALQVGFFSRHPELFHLGALSGGLVPKYIDEEMRNIVEVDLRLAKDFIYDAARVKAHFQRHYRGFESSGRRKFGLSCESFTMTMHNELDVTQKARRIADILGNDCQVIMIIRRQPDILRSIYREWVIGGMFLTFDEFIEASVHNLQSFIWDLRYDQMYDLYVSCFGKANVLVLCFEELQSNPELVLSRIARHLEISEHIRELPRENTHMTDQAIEYLRVRNRLRRYGLGRSAVQPANSWRYPGYFTDKFGIRDAEISGKDVRRIAWHLKLARNQLRTWPYGKTDYFIRPELNLFLERLFGKSNAALSRVTDLDLLKWGYPLVS